MKTISGDEVTLRRQTLENQDGVPVRATLENSNFPGLYLRHTEKTYGMIGFLLHTSVDIY